ncbi:MAG: hypothetical protein AAF436_18050 [Myxococcota bacterium]
MTQKSTIVLFCLLFGAAAGACGDAAALEASLAEAPAPESGEDAFPSNPHGPYGFDVAENMARFAFDDAPLDDDGMPAYGNSFVTQGYIYPFGFLVHHAGTNADGSPAHPEMVIGLWTCRGHFVGEGAQTTTGPWVITTQFYDFFETPGYAEGKASGRHNLVSEGYEIADVDKPVRRVITGASGGAREAGRDLSQQLLGFNESGGVDLRLVIPQGFRPIIPYADLPSDSVARQDQARCVFDLADGLVCPND